MRLVKQDRLATGWVSKAEIAKPKYPIGACVLNHVRQLKSIKEKPLDSPLLTESFHVNVGRFR